MPILASRLSTIDTNTASGVAAMHGRAPLELSLVAEDDVLEALGALGVELRLERRLADQLVAEHHVALEDAAAAPPRRQGPLVLDRLAASWRRIPAIARSGSTSP